MGLIQYDISISPNPAFHLTLQATPTTLGIQFDTYDDFSVSAKPSDGTIIGGSVAAGILSLFTSAIGGAALLAAIPIVGSKISSEIEDKVKSALDGVKGQNYKLDLGHPLGYSLSVSGVDINVTLDSMNFSNYNGMIMASSTIKVNGGGQSS